jgi:hypothetical protein
MRLDSAYRQKMAEAERRPESKRKRKSRKVERVYGLTDEDLARLYEQQGRCCAVCRIPLHLGVETKIDHCHATGRVRGLLCHGCNVALGLMKDNPAAIRRLAEYADDVRRPK